MNSRASYQIWEISRDLEIGAHAPANINGVEPDGALEPKHFPNCYFPNPSFKNLTSNYNFQNWKKLFTKFVATKTPSKSCHFDNFNGQFDCKIILAPNIVMKFRCKLNMFIVTQLRNNFISRVIKPIWRHYRLDGTKSTNERGWGGGNLEIWVKANCSFWGDRKNGNNAALT